MGAEDDIALNLVMNTIFSPGVIDGSEKLDACALQQELTPFLNKKAKEFTEVHIRGSLCFQF